MERAEGILAADEEDYLKNEDKAAQLTEVRIFDWNESAKVGVQPRREQ